MRSASWRPEKRSPSKCSTDSPPRRSHARSPSRCRLVPVAGERGVYAKARPGATALAGYAVGMTYAQCMKLIVLPQEVGTQ